MQKDEEQEQQYEMDHLIKTVVFHDRDEVEFHLKTEIQDANRINKAIFELSALSKEYSKCVVYINSPGGQTNLTVELLSALQLFNTVITVVCGRACSAGFLIWCAGHVKVVQPYSFIMMHRESYMFHSTTAKHREQADFTESLYEPMIRDICGGVLSEGELIKVQKEDVYVKGDDLIERGEAISWSDFIQSESNIQPMKELVTYGDKMFIREGDGLVTEVKAIDVGSTYDENMLKYGINSEVFINNELIEEEEENVG